MKKNKNFFGIIIFVILVLILIALLIFEKYADEENKSYSNDELSLKRYDVNEYIPVNITYDQMARIYLQEYVKKLLYNREEAFNLLDAEYRKKRFSNFEVFNDYVDSLMSEKTKQMTVVKYSVQDKTNYRIFDIYDANDNLFIVKEEGVLQYKVYFDRYTVDVNK